MKIYVPSWSRAGEVTTRKWLSDCILVVAESQAAEYRTREGGNILVVPDSIQGHGKLIVQNYILDHGYDDSQEIVMLDDDMEYVAYREKGKAFKLDEDGFLYFLTNGFRMCKELGAYLWGVNVQSDPMFYMEFAPFSLTTPILGPFTCHIKNDLRYDEKAGLKEDYDFFLQHMKKHRKALRFDKYHYKVKHFENDGGCMGQRALWKEQRDGEYLQNKWGKKIVRFDWKKSVNPILNVPF